eukprot:TRINITY_DN5735_c0_g2_i1.p1 TRINITY_DN5735_c0_g2~~TRINITY_DN5735_c0_g2_i1.p1  ORF type:complete len:373 (+),score=40.75 TRINITY_DN5735_c0_g2_i1:91-1209(+)
MRLTRFTPVYSSPFAGEGPSYQFQDDDVDRIQARHGNGRDNTGRSSQAVHTPENTPRAGNPVGYMPAAGDTGSMQTMPAVFAAAPAIAIDSSPSAGARPAHQSQKKGAGSTRPRHGRAGDNTASSSQCQNRCQAICQSKSTPRAHNHGGRMPQHATEGTNSMQAMPAVFETVPQVSCFPGGHMQACPSPNVLILSQMLPSLESRGVLPAECSPSSSVHTSHSEHRRDDRSASLRAIPEGCTTLAVRNIPARYTKMMLLEEFGPHGSFDYFYVPYSFRLRKTTGMGFLNFRSHALALVFQRKWHRRFLGPSTPKSKGIDIAPADYQGMAENLKRFSSDSIARLARVGMLPVFLDSDGNCLDAMQVLQSYGALQ